MQAPNGSEDGNFWDLRAPSPPPDFDPFARGHAEEQQPPLPPHQQHHPAQAQHQQAPLEDVKISLPSSSHQEIEEHDVHHIQQQQMQQPAAGSCCPISPMSQAGPPLKDTPALGGTPPCLPSGPLKGLMVVHRNRKLCAGFQSSLHHFRHGIAWHRSERAAARVCDDPRAVQPGQAAVQHACVLGGRAQR